MNDRTKKSIELVADVTKQLITLAVLVITITATVLRDDLAGRNVGAGVGAALLAAIISILAGILTMLVLTGTIASDRIQDSQISVYAREIVILGAIQIITFLSAMVLLANTV